MLEIQKEMSGTHCDLFLSGRLDTNTAKQLEEVLNELMTSSSFTINFKKLDYISSAGLRIILGFYKKCKATSKELVLTEMNDLVKEVFDISGFSGFLNIQ